MKLLCGAAFWSIGQPTHANAVAVPVHALPYACKEYGFPQIMETGILGCTKSGASGLWMSVHSGQTEELPVGQWAQGTVLFQTGVHGGLWDLSAWDWSQPKVRVTANIPEGQVYSNEEAVVWTETSSVHHLDISSRLHKQRSASPLTGTHPVPYIDQVAWIEWGEQMGIHLWSPKTNEGSTIASPYPSSLVVHQEQLAWVSEGQIVTWHPREGQSGFREGRVQSVFSTEKGLCWTQWFDDIDIVCENDWRLKRSGHQSHPVWKGDALYFIEDGKLWVLKASGE